MTQLPMFQPAVEWKPLSTSTLPLWPIHGRVAVDTETCDPLLKKLGPGVRRGGYIVGVSFAIEDGPANYLPIRHQGGDNLPVGVVLEYLRDQAAAFKGDLVGANLQYDLDYLAEEGVHYDNVRWFRDIQVAEPLLDELQDSYSLEATAGRHDCVGKDESLLRDFAEAWKIDPKKELWKLPGRAVEAYARFDSELPLRVLRRQERQIEEQNLWDIYNLESRVLPVLLKLRRRGVRVDLSKLSKVEDLSEQREAEALQAVYDETGVRIKVGDVWRKDPLVAVLKKIGVTLDKTPKGQPKLDKETLGTIMHPVARLLEQARKVNKVRTTFAASIREHLTKGRIHSSFNQLRREREDGLERGAAYGRLSSENPNMQQQPSRDKVWGKLWRSIYIPEEGQLWFANDYSQQEPRLITHYAEAANCNKSTVAGDLYRKDPSADSHQMMADITGLERSPAKIIYLGLAYSMGGATLCRGMKLPTQWVRKRDGKMLEVAGEEGQSILDQFDRQAPFIKELARRCERVASKRGYIVTLLGRRCRFDKDKQGNYDYTHKALNRLIQGSAADQTKLALVEGDKAGHYIQLQVHDELDGSCENPEQAHKLAEIMRTCVKLSIPCKVDVEIGPSWGEAE